MKKAIKKCCGFLLNPFKTTTYQDWIDTYSFKYRKAIKENNSIEAISYIDQIINLAKNFNVNITGLYVDRAVENMKLQNFHIAYEDLKKAEELSKEENVFIIEKVAICLYEMNKVHQADKLIETAINRSEGGQKEIFEKIKEKYSLKQVSEESLLCKEDSNLISLSFSEPKKDIKPLDIEQIKVRYSDRNI